jgi:predicted ATPase/class 3 adenylate cyclase
MAVPPTGTVTFLFTDIEGSTALWEDNPGAMQHALARHDGILRRTVEDHAGFVFKTMGDAFCCAFPTAPDAFEAAFSSQRALSMGDWGEIGPLRVRMALHTGAAEEQCGDYFGPPLNRVARLLSAAHGSQVLLSLPTQELVRDLLPLDAELRDLGEHRLKDLARPERIYQLVATGLPTDFPPLRTLESRPNNLPMQPTLLVGREREVEDIRGRLLAPEVRLLTLTGPGGTGKSRLALQAAADLIEEFEDGVYFVALATLTDPTLVASSVAQVLGVRESGNQPLIEGIEDYLQDKRLLLVLDNFEQILEAAPLASELLSSAPHLKVLATSRIPLRIYGEREYAVPPLAIPDPKMLPALEVLSQYEAVRLFIERAEAAKAGFEITSENAPAVAEICARLDGLPLAIELAAARIKLLPPNAILARLSNRLKLLTGGARDLPERQRTLRGAIEWSHTLLEEGEKTLFARMAVFSGGRTLEAVEAVCDAEGDLPMDVFDGVSSLVDNSLLRQEEGPESEPRFVMLETIHEYAREKLRESGEADQIGRAHTGYFLALAEEAEPELTGSDQVGWLERLEAEHDNLRAALSRSLERSDAELGLGLASALLYFWFQRGYWGEGRGWLEEALAVNAGAAAPLRAKALGGWQNWRWSKATTTGRRRLRAWLWHSTGS